LPIESINPYDGSLIETYSPATDDQVESVLERAAATFDTWRDTPIADRAERMRAAAAILCERAEPYATLMAREMGKPLAQGRAEITKCAWAAEYYADHAARFLAPEPVDAGTVSSHVAFAPLGVVLAVMPWNFPFWQVFRFAAPALMAGNTAILKHASNVSGCALEIESVFVDAGFPAGAFSTLLISSGRVAGLVADRRVRAVTLTGSTPAGRAVASVAGQHLKKTVLELGGSDPYLILDEAELERTAQDCAAARLVNGGQSCVAAKRFIVLEAFRPRFEALLVEAIGRRRTGDPLAADTDVGPQARRDLRDELHAQVEASIAAGARLLLGGQVPEGPGAMYPPTVLTGVTPGMPAYDQELFGPVAAIIAARDEDDAIRIANDSDFGLGAAVYTTDRTQAQRVVDRLDAGNCFINGFVRSDPRLPFGGVKDSGYGRELAAFGIREFVNIKTVCRII
jgi:succinate-semialdehyde dehydrogenase/glutarate-semialdehyde dehydrogenase